VQIVYSSHRGSRDIEHIGSHYKAELEVLKATTRHASPSELRQSPSSNTYLVICATFSSASTTVPVRTNMA